ncbi:uncharacterized protein LOC144449751 [Glandiceps talaboti]
MSQYQLPEMKNEQVVIATSSISSVHHHHSDSDNQEVFLCKDGKGNATKPCLCKLWPEFNISMQAKHNYNFMCDKEENSCGCDDMMIDVVEEEDINDIDIELKMDIMLSFYIVCELTRSPTFLKNFRKFILCADEKIALGNDVIFEIIRHRRTKIDTRKVLLCPTKNVSPRLYRIGQDLAWSNRLLPQIDIQIYMDDVFSWLSTLGGAYSSLGDYFLQCSSKAGRISVQQLYLAWSMGDAVLQSKSKLFLAQSLMQRGYLRHAKIIIRKQYIFAISRDSGYDQRLYNMCMGTWHRLKYFYQKRRERLTNKQSCQSHDRNGLQSQSVIKHFTLPTLLIIIALLLTSALKQQPVEDVGDPCN